MHNTSSTNLWKLMLYTMVSVCIQPLASKADMLVSTYDLGTVLRYDEKIGAYLGSFVSPRSGGLQAGIGLAFGPDGNLYVADSIGNAILRYHGQSGAFLGVFATNNWLYPNGITFGPDGNLYAAVSTGIAGAGLLLANNPGKLSKSLTLPVLNNFSR
jgi:sugar lactone lactonase YvrE